MLMLAAADSWAGSSDDKEPVEPFDRGIGTSTTVFVPKGTVNTGISFSYNTVDLGQAADDAGYSMLFDLVNGLNGSMYTFGLAPHVSYFVADNLSVGGRPLPTAGALRSSRRSGLPEHTASPRNGKWKVMTSSELTRPYRRERSHLCQA